MAGIQDDPRTYFAAERTFLAWIRTGLGLMGVGFAVARFGLFLRELRASETHGQSLGNVIHGTGLSVFAGVGLVVLGVMVNVVSVLQHIQTVQELRAGTWASGRVSLSAVVLGLVLAAVGMGMAGYLLYLR